MAKNVEKALEIAARYGGGNEEHHQAWVVDQMVRALTGNNYEAWIDEVKSGEDGTETYTWNTGIAP